MVREQATPGVGTGRMRAPALQPWQPRASAAASRGSPHPCPLAAAPPWSVVRCTHKRTLSTPAGQQKVLAACAYKEQLNPLNMGAVTLAVDLVMSQTCADTDYSTAALWKCTTNACKRTTPAQGRVRHAWCSHSPVPHNRHGGCWASHRLPAPPLLLLLLLTPPLRKARLLRLAQPHTW